MRGSLGRLLIATIVGVHLLSSIALSEESIPFVAGFDRFYSAKGDADTIAGDLLLTELSCTACHATDSLQNPKAGPELKGILSRLQPTWLRNYFKEPDNVKPGGLMPHLLHQLAEDERDDAIEALIAFLSSAKESEEPKIVASGGNPVTHEFWLKGDTSRGRGLYHQIGCIACHAIDSEFVVDKPAQSDLQRKIESLGLEPDELAEMGLVLPKPVNPIPMSSIRSKYSLRSLSMFLIAPHLIRPSGRMPSLKLQPHEAADIAAYLFASKSQQTFDDEKALTHDSSKSKTISSDELIDRGRKLFDELACASCHAHSQVKPRLSKPLVDLDLDKKARSCLEPNNLGPRYNLSASQKVALRRSIASMQANLQAKRSGVGSDALDFKLLQLNCYACHERDGRGGVGLAQGTYFENVQQVDIGDEGRLPPPLDHVGRKLNAASIQKVLEGKGDVRPHFRARMPVFTGHAKSLAAALVEADQKVPLPAIAGMSALGTIDNVLNADLEAGRQLLDAGCVQCHPLRGEALPGAIGIDIADLATRIQPEWFHAFLLSPASLKKNTRMPSFFPEGKSSNPHILNGDIPLQIASLWRYLNTKDQPLPTKLEQSRSQFSELQPIDRPILLRTFMESTSAGTHAIAVGFPEQFHFAFDAKRLRLAELWKGRFLDAQGTWFDRFAPLAVPLGNARVLLPIDAWVESRDDGTIKSIDSSNVAFKGFVFDADGIPTFRYQVGRIELEDRSAAKRDEGILRRISAKPVSSSHEADARRLWIVVADDAVAIDSRGVCATQSKLKIHVSENAERQTRMHGNTFDWMIAIPELPVTIEVRYRW